MCNRNRNHNASQGSASLELFYPPPGEGVKCEPHFVNMYCNYRVCCRLLHRQRKRCPESLRRDPERLGEHICPNERKKERKKPLGITHGVFGGKNVVPNILILYNCYL